MDLTITTARSRNRAVDLATILPSIRGCQCLIAKSTSYLTRPQKSINLPYFYALDRDPISNSYLLCPSRHHQRFCRSHQPQLPSVSQVYLSRFAISFTNECSPFHTRSTFFRTLDLELRYLRRKSLLNGLDYCSSIAKYLKRLGQSYMVLIISI